MSLIFKAVLKHVKHICTKNNKPHDFSILKYSRKSGFKITESVMDFLANRTMLSTHTNTLG